MWESPIYRFEEETTDEKTGKLVKQEFHINVTYSAPRNLTVPGIALEGIFNKITTGYDPKNTNILDVGAARLRNTFWFLEKRFNVWAVEFPELQNRLPDVKAKWAAAEAYPNFNKVTFPKDFIELKVKFDFVLLVNVVNVIPMPLERYALLSLCREKSKEGAVLLWHHYRGESIHADNEKFLEKNYFADGYLGQGPNHTFYTEFNPDETDELLFSIGFSHNMNINLRKISSNTGAYSYVFNPTHDSLINNTLKLENMKKDVQDGKQVLPIPAPKPVLQMYKEELPTVPKGSEDAKQRNVDAHTYHLLASRIFFEIFRNQVCAPQIEQEINEGRGRIDIVYKNKNQLGIFKDLKDTRNILCPDIIVECKNYDHNLEITEYNQIADRLIEERGMLGFLICRDKKNENKVLAQCRDKRRQKKYIIVLDDKDLELLSNFKLNDEDDTNINDYVNLRIRQIID
jgi:hypothetical protein